jgi:hypothetical protein
MNYRPLNDVIDPEVTPQDETVEPSGGPAEDRDDGYVIGEDGRGVVNLELSEAFGRREFAPPRPWLKPAAVALALLFVALTCWNVWRLTHPASMLPTPTPFQVKQALYLGVMRVEAYRKIHGVAPERLEDAGLPSDSGYAYGRIDSKHYNLSFERDGRSFDYDSDIPVETAFGSPKEMLNIGGSQ